MCLALNGAPKGRPNGKRRNTTTKVTVQLLNIWNWTHWTIPICSDWSSTLKQKKIHLKKRSWNTLSLQKMSVSSTKRRWEITIVSPFSLLIEKPFKYPPETALTPYIVSFKCISPNNIRLTYSFSNFLDFLDYCNLLDFDAPLVHSMCSWRSFSSSFSQFNLYL